MKTACAGVILSEQDLSDFLEENQQYMEAYRFELECRLTEYFGEATVEISNCLTDSINIDNDPDDFDVTDQIMNQMVHDWSWLEQE